MHEYDSVLKNLFQASATATLRALTGQEIVRWLNIQFSTIQNREVDLLGEVSTGDLLHIELQSSNDPHMPLRMAEYWLAIYRQQRKMPRQIVVYVGREPLTMPRKLAGPGMSFEYELIDMRELDGDRLLTSSQVSDNVIGILGHLADARVAVRKLMARLGKLDVDAGRRYLRASLILAGLRGLAGTIEREARNMPVHIDILETGMLGREFLRGLREGESAILRTQLEKRFGTLPQWATEKLTSASHEQLEAWAVAVLDATSLEQLLK